MIKIIINLIVLFGSVSVFSSEMDFREKHESLNGILPDIDKVSIKTPYNRKCEELGGEANMISCHQTTDTYQDGKYNLMITELEAACLETNNGDTASFVVSDVWSFETNNYDVRSYCFCFDQDI